ncbi:HD domain-containing protein [Clostridium estertheticum]|uniref:HD-GYP domain-containing protein n=1 Tax=Clostridium estertheticum TaxID=238834 RepID=UPI0013E94E4A|nr:HD domain-containing phosphohydrolase [Clostridium estertheticum]MBZ9686620.1 HD domain-containing protein [Clostridium estertheticum]
MKISTRSLIEGLSYALDVAEKSYFSHSKHVAYLSVMIAMELDLPKEQQEELYYAALLHDIGASNTYLIQEHCEVGRDIILKLPIKSIIAEYVYYHHEHYDGTGPFKLKADEIPLPSQIICIANLFDTKFGSIETLNLETLNEINKWIDSNHELFKPEIVETFYRLIEKEYIFLDYFTHEFNNVLVKRIEIIRNNIGFEDVKLFAHAFSQIIDKRSTFTYEHSVGISNLVNKITTQLGYNYEIQNKMYIAALLHDIGKLVISNDIIDKKGKLDEEERYQINKHTYYTRWILEQIEGFGDITNYASNHHEKLNGNGYPLHLAEEQISELDRVMAICDVYQALTEDRPYRTKMPIDKVWSIINEMVNNNDLDGNLVGKIKTILKEAII